MVERGKKPPFPWESCIISEVFQECFFIYYLALTFFLLFLSLHYIQLCFIALQAAGDLSLTDLELQQVSQAHQSSNRFWTKRYIIKVQKKSWHPLEKHWNNRNLKAKFWGFLKFFEPLHLVNNSINLMPFKSKTQRKETSILCSVYYSGWAMLSNFLFWISIWKVNIQMKKWLTIYTEIKHLCLQRAPSVRVP